MTSTVLGKRNSSSLDSAATPSKRQTRSSSRRDEPVSHFEIHEDNQAHNQNGHFMQIDSPKDNQSLLRDTVLAKHGEPGQRIALSPTKINSHFKVTKPDPVYNEKDQSCIEDEQKEQAPTPRTPRHRDALSKKVPVTPRHRVAVSGAPITPRTPRTNVARTVPAKSVYNDARRVFAKGTHPGPLVGRQNEREQLQSFIRKRIESREGGSLYVSGPPGTGKSALVGQVCQEFKEVEGVRYDCLNCMSVKRAGDAFTYLATSLEILDDAFGQGEKRALSKAFQRNDKASKSTIHLVVLDEIDQLLSVDLEALYTLYEFSLRLSSNLILIGIANALDLTDRFLPRLKSRNLKPQLLPFLPYVAPEIASVLTARLRSLLSDISTASLDFTPVIVPPAIQLISKKVAAQTGDLRKALDIAQRAVDLVEHETKEKLQKDHEQHDAAAHGSQCSPSRTPLGENINLSSPSSATAMSPAKPSPRTPTKQASTLLASLTPETAPRVTLAHVIKVTAAAFNSGASSRLKGLNLQQKAILCSLVAMEQRKRHMASAEQNDTVLTPVSTPSRKLKHAATPSKRINAGGFHGTALKALYEAYGQLCLRENLLSRLSATEFRDVMSNLETSSLVSCVAGRGNPSIPGTPSRRGRGWTCGNMGGGSGLMGIPGSADERRWCSCVDVGELAAAVEGVGEGVLKRILGGEDLY